MRRGLTTLLLLLSLCAGVLLAQPLPTQVLQLLARDNTWTGQQTFQNLRLPAFLPADTALRLYTDGTNLFWAGTALTGGGSVTTPHNLLSTTHPDTLAASPPTRGDIVCANSTPKWARFALGASGTFLRSDGTDCTWSTVGSTLTALNATQLTSGTVPLARISGLLNAQVDAAAAIAWSKLSTTGSSLADLTTRSAADLSSGTLLDARLSSNVSLFGSSVDTSEIDAGAITSPKIADFSCTAGQAMTWQLTGWTCGTFGTGSGTVTSVALSLPAIITVTGSPVTTTGTLTGTLATQTNNFVWAGPTTAPAAAPTFRALVAADFPLSGASAGTYTKVTVTTRGLVTAGVATIDLTTDGGATILPFANGGTGLSSAADDTLLLSTGAAWTANALSNCANGLAYNTTTNVFSCVTAPSFTTVTVGSSGNAITLAVTGTKTWDPGNILDGDAETTTLTVTGAVVGQVCTASQSTLTAATLVIAAFPSAADTVRVVLNNNSGGAVDITSGTLRAACIAF